MVQSSNPSVSVRDAFVAGLASVMPNAAPDVVDACYRSWYREHVEPLNISMALRQVDRDRVRELAPEPTIEQLGAYAAFERAAGEMIEADAWQLRSTVRGERFTLTREVDTRQVTRDHQ